MYNKLGLTYENTTLGKFQFFADDFRSNYYYNQILIRDDKTIPASLTRNINMGGQYEYQKKELEWEVLVFKVSDESILI
jgi:hypothetical protein